MKIVLIVDKFKESLSAGEVAEIITAGLQHRKKGDIIYSIPLADGGDGTVEALGGIADGQKISVETVDPLGRKIVAVALRIGDRYICEMAQSTGLVLLSKEERDPTQTSSYGLGIMIKNIAGMGAKELIVGIGGSATNDCGVGMLQALGYRFYDKKGDVLKPLSEDKRSVKESLSFENENREDMLRGKDLIRIGGVDDSEVPEFIKQVKIIVANDVTNPLTGIYGATKVYGPQKGATTTIIEELESGVVNFAGVAAKFLGENYSGVSGAGAAGGVGFALHAFLRAELRQGWRLLFDMLDVEKRIKEADLVITGEGRVDGQSLSGKLMDGICSMCAKHNKRLIVICGDNRLTEKELERAGVEKLFAISHREPVKERAIKNARQHLYEIAGQIE